MINPSERLRSWDKSDGPADGKTSDGEADFVLPSHPLVSQHSQAIASLDLESYAPRTAEYYPNLASLPELGLSKCRLRNDLPETVQMLVVEPSLLASQSCPEVRHSLLRWCVKVVVSEAEPKICMEYLVQYNSNMAEHDYISASSTDMIDMRLDLAGHDSSAGLEA